MGIGDRAYMRNRSASREPVSATAWTVGILVAFFVLSLVQESAHADFLGWAVLGDSSPRLWQFLTHAWLHEGFWHLLGNCLVLWWTGAIVEREHGPDVFVKVLLAGATAGAAVWYLTGLGGPGGSEIIGMSAGAYALMLVALLDKLDQQVTLLLFFFLPVTLKVRWLLLLVALFALLGWGFSELPARHDWPAWKAAWRDGIAHSAHLGGLIFGWLAFRRLNQTNLRVQGAVQGMTRAESPDPSAIAREAYAAEAETGGAADQAPAALTRTQARAELDRLLDKISAGGFGSLTPDEKRRLEELSARLR
jgi:membrane associated rhomboid family serine protease